MHRLYDWLLRHIITIWRSAEKVYPKLQQEKKNNAKEDNSTEEKVTKGIAMGSVAPATDRFFVKLSKKNDLGFAKVWRTSLTARHIPFCISKTTFSITSSNVNSIFINCAAPKAHLESRSQTPFWKPISHRLSNLWLSKTTLYTSSKINCV